MKKVSRILISLLVALCVMGYTQQAFAQTGTGGMQTNGMIGDPEH